MLVAHYGKEGKQDSVMAKCKVCGKEYDVDNLVRSQGNVLWRAMYCSAGCYTRVFMEKVQAGRDEQQSSLEDLLKKQKNNHTQGDWHVRWWEDEQCVDGGHWGVTDSRGHGLFMANQKGRHKRTEANAHVAAASPKLLAACELMLEDLNGDGLIRLETRMAIVTGLRKAKPTAVIHTASQGKATK